MTKLHAGGKFENTAYKVSGGLHGVGVSCVNALSEWLKLEISRNGKVYEQKYARGIPQQQVTEIGTTDKRGTKVWFKPDTTIFETTDFQLRHAQPAPARARLPQRRAEDQHHRRAQPEEPRLRVPGRHRQLRRVHQQVEGDPAHSPVFFKAEKDGVALEIAMQWNDGYDERIYTFANNINTHEGGSHLVGFKSALTRTINGYAERGGLWKDLKETPTGEDAREGLAAVISIKLPNPQFEGQTKTKLGNSEVKGLVEQMVNEQLAHLARGEPHRGEEDRRQDRRRHPGPHRRPQGPRDGAPQGRARRDVAPRQAGRLPEQGPERERALHRRGRLGRRLGQAGPRPAQPGHPPPAREDPERREDPLREDAHLAGDRGADHRAGDRHRERGLRAGEVPLPPDHPHDRRGRGRKPHPHAAAHVLLPADAGAHRARLPLRRPAAALQGHPREEGAVPQGPARPRRAPDAHRRGPLRGGSLRAGRGGRVPRPGPPRAAGGHPPVRGAARTSSRDARDPRILDALVQAARVDETTLLDMDRLVSEVEKMHAWLGSGTPRCWPS